MTIDKDLTFPHPIMVVAPGNEGSFRFIEAMMREQPLVLLPLYDPTPINLPIIDDIMFRDHDPMIHTPAAITRNISEFDRRKSNTTLAMVVALTAISTNIKQSIRRTVSTLSLREEVKSLERSLQKYPHRGDLRLKITALRNQIRDIEKENAECVRAKQKAKLKQGVR